MFKPTTKGGKMAVEVEKARPVGSACLSPGGSACLPPRV